MVVWHIDLRDMCELMGYTPRFLAQRDIDTANLLYISFRYNGTSALTVSLVARDNDEQIMLAQFFAVDNNNNIMRIGEEISGKLTAERTAITTGKLPAH